MVVLRLYLSAIDAKRFKVIVTDSPGGEGEADSVLPFGGRDDRRKSLLKTLELRSFRAKSFRGEGEQDWMVRVGLLTEERSAFHPDALANIGQVLYKSLFPEKSKVKKLLENAIASAQENETQLHIQLTFSDNVQRARLPDYSWELAHDGQDFLAHRQVTFSRYIATDSAAPNLPPVKRVNVLLLSSAAFDRQMGQQPLSQQEREAVRSGLAKAEQEGHIHLDEKRATLDQLRAYLTQQRPHVIHFDGHGLFGKRCNACKKIHRGVKADKCKVCESPLPDPQGYLVFEDEAGAPDYVSAKQLGVLLEQASFSDSSPKPDRVALVVLSACHSGASLAGDSIFNGVAQRLISHRVPAVVAMQYAVSVFSAADFAKQFYRSLGQLEPLTMAVSKAREAMGVEGNQWYRPILYLRWQDNQGGQLFAPIVDPQLVRAYLDEVRLEFDYWQQRYVTLSAHSTLQARHRKRPKAVSAPRHFRPRRYRLYQKPSSSILGEKRESKHFDDVRDAVAEAGDAVLLGEPGAGKTTSLWRLMLDYADQAENDSMKPLPILVPLAGYDGKSDLLEFIRHQLSEAFTFIEDEEEALPAHRQLAERLEDSLIYGRVALFFDGLNELPRDSYTCAVTKLLAFRKHYPNNRTLFTCREVDYSHTIRLPLPEIHIEPLDDDRIHDFINAYLLDKATGLVDYLQNENQAMWEMGRNPFLLDLIVDIYAERGTLPANRSELFGQFVKELLARESVIHPDRWQVSQDQPTAHAQTRLLFDLMSYWPALSEWNSYLNNHGLEGLSKDDRQFIIQAGLTVTALGQLAVTMNRAGQQLCARNLVVDYLPENIALGGCQVIYDLYKLLYLARSASLLEHTPAGYRFTHQLLQEYFAAVYLNTLEPNDPDLLKHLGDEAWDETVLLLAGLTPQLNSLVEHLLDRDPYQAARCAGVRPDSLSSHIASHLVETLASLTENDYGSWREKAIVAYQQGLPFAREGSAEWARIQVNLAATLIQRFRVLGQAEDVERALVLYEEVLPSDHSLLAHFQLKVAFVCSQAIVGKRAENIELAIEACQKAVKVFPLQGIKWGNGMNLLGGAYCERIRGQRAENLEQGIGYLKLALQARTPNMPEMWAETTINLASAYGDRIKGERSDNLELSIMLYQQALEVLRPQTMRWAQATMGLGSVYGDRIRGERAENLEQAIELTQQALKVLTPNVMGIDWIKTRINLGKYYFDRIKGKRAENLEQAIKILENALSVVRSQKIPEEWLVLGKIGLANAYRERICGERAKNLEKSFKLCHEIRAELTPEVIPMANWGLMLINLAAAYALRIRGERAENIEQAIAIYQEAQKVFEDQKMRLERAQATRELGQAYRIRIRGNRAQNIEKAIELFGEARETLTREAIPFEWATTMIELGNAYLERIKGNRTENIEQAIDAYQSALEVHTQEAMPIEWAKLQNNLGIAYRNRTSGGRAENIERAIKAYQASLQVRTRKGMPVDWAQTKLNLGAAYFERLRGNWRANCEEAILCYEESLEVYTRQAMPHQWASTMMNLARAYQHRLVGGWANNLQEAIKIYHQIVEVYTREAMPLKWARTMLHLGLAYQGHRGQDRAQKLEKAIAAYEQALQVLTPETMALDRARIMNNLADAYALRGQGNRASNIKQALDCYQKALQIQTVASFPSEHRQTQRNLGNLYFMEGSWEKAYAAYTAALEAGELLYQQNSTPEARQAELRGARLLPARMAYTLARLGRFTEAIKTLEQNKSRILSEALARHEAALESASSDDRKAFSEALAHVATLEAKAYAEDAEDKERVPDFVTVSTELGQARQKLTQIIRRIQSDVPEFMPKGLDFDGVAQVAKDLAQPLVYLLTTPHGSLALLVAPAPISDGTTSPLAVLWLDEWKEQNLNHILYQGDSGPYLQGTVGNKIDLLKNVLLEAWPLLARLMTPLAQRLHELGYQQAVLIPVGTLNLLPLHAICLASFERSQKLAPEPSTNSAVKAAPASTNKHKHPLTRTFETIRKKLGRLFATAPIELQTRSDLASETRSDMSPALSPQQVSLAPAVTFTLAPSARALLSALATAQQKQSPVLLGIGNPSANNQKPLPFARLEIEHIAPLFAAQRTYVEAQATRPTILNDLSGATHLHFSCHGTFNIDNPLDSALYLAGNDTLTLRHLLSSQLDLSAARLAVLSACQTGITDFLNVPDEAIGFPAGFLQAGVPGVISTLWPVTDISTALLLARFYSYHLAEGLAPALALHKAQEWLRQAPVGEVASYLEKCYRRAKWAKTAQLLTEMRHYRHQAQKNPSERPFEHPYYWAAFVFSGI